MATVGAKPEPPPQKRASVGTRIRRWALYLLYLAALFLIPIYFFFYRPFVADLRAVGQPADEVAPVGPVPSSVMRQIGSLVVDRASSFVHHPVEKPEGETRICALGDSFTHGDEVGPDEDYPSRLERILHERGYDHVRVLNFGSPWHGFHQSYILWDRVAREYGCDVVALGPRTFWTRRETHFNHTNLRFPYYLHARYVLDGDDVRLVEVLGDTPEDRFDGYFGFFPRWRYLRYDADPPSLLRCLVGKDRTLPNPFYYRRGSRDDEALETYRLLLAKMAEDAGRILLTHSDERILGLGRDPRLSNVTTFPAFNDDRFPYRAPFGHNSVWGNDALAWSFYRAWASDTETDDVRLVSGDRPTSDAGLRRRALSEYNGLAVMLGGHAIGKLVTASVQPWKDGLWSPMAFWGKEVASILAVEGEGSSIVDGRLVPLDFDLAHEAEVRLRNADGSFDDLLGRVVLVDRNLPVGRIRIPALRVRADEELLWIDDLPVPAGERLTIYVGDRPILESWLDGDRTTFWPLDDGEMFKFAAESAWIDPRDFAESGTYDLLLTHPADGPVRVPLADWRSHGPE